MLKNKPRKVLGYNNQYKQKKIMKKIQITTIATTAEVQMLAPNTYFITKAVKALYALKQVENDIKEQEKFIEDHHRKDLKCIELPIEDLKNKIQPSLDFLDELLSTMEEE